LLFLRNQWEKGDEWGGGISERESKRGLTGHWKTWIPWVTAEELEESRGSPGILKDLKDLLANPTTWGRLAETLRMRVIPSL
jgi:hypothetical protein